ncbi:hypothetical protein H5410_050575 [Solanum commersonii]|uniref:Uncharacterized protein n=1 Tax=Solanum commersonii TaxID=4109 RepID=A0A9J5WY01_SOLCO|nr:hypothetical protein H5410_050575 [Solanum commersonii]
MQETNREAYITNNHSNGQSSQHTRKNNTKEQWQSQGNARNNDAEGNGSTLQQNQTTNSNLQAHETGQIHGILGYTVAEGKQNQQQKKGRFAQNSEYDVPHLEDEFDKDTQSINDDEDGEETNAHLTKSFGSTFQNEFQDEIQEATKQKGLSPKGRKQVRSHTRQDSISTSVNSSRPNTRSISKGF